MNPVVAEWMEKAEGDFATAQRELAAQSMPNYDAVCFHAQQAIEKLMKAALIQFGVTPPRTHDLVILHELLRMNRSDWSCSVSELRALVLGAIHFRYPGSMATREDAAEALTSCERLRKSLLELLPAAE